MMIRFILCAVCIFCTYTVSAQWKFEQKSGVGHFYAENSRTTVHIRNYLAHGKYETKELMTSPDGKLKWVRTCAVNYVNGYMDGYYLRTTVNGDTLETGNYSMGKRIGQWRGYANAQRTYIYNYEAGNKSGWQYDYADGEIIRRNFYSGTGVHYEWTYNQHKLLIARGQYVSDSLRNGEWYWYDTTLHFRSTPADTMPVRICGYRNGQLHGADKLFTKGVLQSHRSYVDGKKHGAHLEYRNSILVGEENYANDQLDGIMRRRSDGGKLISEYSYSSGKLNGTSTDFDTSSATATRIQMHEQGVLVSLKEYAGKALITEQLLVERDSLVYTCKEFYPNGSKKSNGRKIGTRRTGSYESWHANGKKKMTTAFRNDEYIGSIDIWNDRGIKVFHSRVWNSSDTLKEEVWSDAGARLPYGTIAYEKQRAKYIPEDVVAYYDDFVTLGQIIITVYPKRPYEERPGTDVYSSIWHGFDGEVEAPEYPGGEKGIVQHVDTTANYPAYEFEEHIEGESVVTFTIRDDGSITAIKIFRSSSPGLDAASMDIVRSMVAWKPAKKYGSNREVRCWLEIEWRRGKFKEF